VRPTQRPLSFVLFALQLACLCHLEPLGMVGYPIPRKAYLACSNVWEPIVETFESSI
jgi:hypothetical protein